MPNFIILQGRTYHFRRRVPGRLRKRLGQREFYRSLRTSVWRDASIGAARLFLATEVIFAMADDARLTDEEIRAAARQWLAYDGRQHTAAIDRMSPAELSKARADIGERRLEWSPERLADEEMPPSFATTQARLEAEDALERSGFEPTIERKHVVNRGGTWNVKPVRAMPPPGFVTTRSWNQDDVRRMQGAMRDVLDEYAERRWVAMSRPPGEEGKATSVAKPAGSGRLLDACVEELITEKARKTADHRSWTPQSQAQARATFRLLKELIGVKPVGEYCRRDAGEFRKLLLQLPASFGKSPGKLAAQAIQAANATEKGRQVPRMTMKTVKRHFSACSSMWKWLKSNGDVTENIFIGWEFPGTKSKKKKRLPWIDADLKRLFNLTSGELPMSVPPFTGCHLSHYIPECVWTKLLTYVLEPILSKIRTYTTFTYRSVVTMRMTGRRKQKPGIAAFQSILG